MKRTIAVAILVIAIAFSFPAQPQAADPDFCYSGWQYIGSDMQFEDGCIVKTRFWYCWETEMVMPCGQLIVCTDERGTYDIECELDE